LYSHVRPRHPLLLVRKRDEAKTFNALANNDFPRVQRHRHNPITHLNEVTFGLDRDTWVDPSVDCGDFIQFTAQPAYEISIELPRPHITCFIFVPEQPIVISNVGGNQVVKPHLYDPLAKAMFNAMLRPIIPNAVQEASSRSSCSRAWLRDFGQVL